MFKEYKLKNKELYFYIGKIDYNLIYIFPCINFCLYNENRLNIKNDFYFYIRFLIFEISIKTMSPIILKDEN